MNIKFLTETAPLHGSHSGYQLLIRYVQELAPDASEVQYSHRLPFRIADRLGIDKRRMAGFFFYHQASRRLHPEGVYHVLTYESYHQLWNRWDKAPANLVATLHGPTPQNRSKRELDILKRVSSAIVLSQQNIAYLQSDLGIERVRFIRHGVDTDFFYPTTSIPAPLRLAFVGRVFRNRAMLQRVVTRLAQDRPELQFDLVVPKAERDHPDLEPLLAHPSVTWHSGVSDEDLRKIYQRSYLLLLPLDKAAANNSIVEAMACGLPVASTDVGGVRDYGGGTIYPIVPNNHDDAMIDLIESYIANTEWRQTVARNCREFAEQYLDWRLIARQHIEFYTELLD